MRDELAFSDPRSSLAGWVSGRVEQWEQHRNQNYELKWDEYYRLWRGIWATEDKTRSSERSKLVAPALQQAIEAAVAELSEATFGNDQWFDIRDDIADQDPSDIAFVRNMLKEDLERGGAKTAINEILLNGAIYGTGIGKIITEQTTEVTPAEQPVEGTLTTVRGVVENTVVQVKLEPVAPMEFVIDPTATSINEALGVAHIVIKPRYLVVQGIEDGIYEDKPIGSYNEADFGFDEEARTPNADDRVKITEYWGLVPKKFLRKTQDTEFDYESDDLVEGVVTIANDSTVLRAVENPFMMKDRPFVAYQHDTVPNKFWGRGVTEKGYNPQKALDAELRARIDGLALTTHPMMALDATRLPRGSKFEVRPGKTILTNGDPRTVLNPINFGQMSQTTFQEAAELERMIQMGTGSMDTATSNSANPRNATASGMSMLQAASIKRQKRTLMNFQDAFLIPMVNKAVWRKMQFDPQRYPVMDYKFVPSSTMGIMAKELEQTQLIQLLSLVQQDSPAFGILMMGIFENSSLTNRDQMMQAIQQGMTPSPEQQQAQQAQMQMQMQAAQIELEQGAADVQKTQAQTAKYMVDAQAKELPPVKIPEVEMAKTQLELQERAVNLQEKAAKVANLRSETLRNVPEMEHLNSEIALNMAKARQAAVDAG